MSIDVIKEKIKERLDPAMLLEKVGVVDYSVKNSEIRCGCPIHHGDGPNFAWNLNTNTWTCFSHHCGENRDIPRDAFLLVMLTKKVSFLDALRILAGWVGVPIDGVAFNKEEEDMYKIKRWLERQKLLDGKQNKVLDEAILDEFERVPHPYMLRRGFSQEVMTEWEIAYAKTGPFANRIVIPIRDENGQLVGFSGRLATDDRVALEEHGKYKNMMDFSSGAVLFGLNKAKPFVQRDGIMVLVEGFFDVINCAQAGLRNVCATMGTSILPEQIDLVLKYASTVYLAYDNDGQAGYQATKRIYNKLRNFCDIYIMEFPAHRKDLGEMTPAEIWESYSYPTKPIDYFSKRESV